MLRIIHLHIGHSKVLWRAAILTVFSSISAPHIKKILSKRVIFDSAKILLFMISLFTLVITDWLRQIYSFQIWLWEFVLVSNCTLDSFNLLNQKNMHCTSGKKNWMHKEWGISFERCRYWLLTQKLAQTNLLLPYLVFAKSCGFHESKSKLDKWW